MLFFRVFLLFFFYTIKHITKIRTKCTVYFWHAINEKLLYGCIYDFSGILLCDGKFAIIM